MLASGWTAEGETWVLEMRGDPDDLYTLVTVNTVDGRSSGGGAGGGPALQPGQRLSTYVGSATGGARRFIARVSADVAAVVVTLSDGTREDLVLHGNPDVFGARAAVLIYRRDLDIHRVDLFNRAGRALADKV